MADTRILRASARARERALAEQGKKKERALAEQEPARERSLIRASACVIRCGARCGTPLVAPGPCSSLSNQSERASALYQVCQARLVRV
jgi:hypothetical protein